MQKKTWDKTTITTIVTILSLIIAMVSITVQLRTKTLQLNCNVLSSTELTSVYELPGLSSEFTYHNKRVSHLWKVTLNYINSGNITLVGIGQHSVLIGDGLSFWFPHDTEILNYEVTSKDIPLTVEQIQPNGFKIKFSQWRPNEKATISLYIAASSIQTYPLAPTVTTRDIVGGNVNIANAMNSINSKRMPFLFGFPVVISVMIKTILSLFCLIVCAFGFYLFPRGFINFIKRSNWQKHQLTRFKSFIQSQSNLKVDIKKKYIKDPSDVPAEIWANYTGPKLPRENFVGFGNYSEATIFTTVFLLLGGILCLYLSDNLIDLYYSVTAYFTNT